MNGAEGNVSVNRGLDSPPPQSMRWHDNSTVGEIASTLETEGGESAARARETAIRRDQDGLCGEMAVHGPIFRGRHGRCEMPGGGLPRLIGKSLKTECGPAFTLGASVGALGSLGVHFAGSGQSHGLSPTFPFELMKSVQGM